MDFLDRNDDPFADGDDAFGDIAEGGAPFPEGEIAGADGNDGDLDPFAEAAPEEGQGPSEGVGGDLLSVDSSEAKSSTPLPDPQAVDDEEDCSALMSWKAKWRLELEGKAAAAAQKKEERRRAAQEELESMAVSRQKALDARSDSNRQNEMAFLEAHETLAQPGSNPWERVVSLVDTQVSDSESAKATDRMRTILIRLKGQKSGPGID